MHRSETREGDRLLQINKRKWLKITEGQRSKKEGTSSFQKKNEKHENGYMNVL